jgi:hypothetical protein
LLFGLHDIRKEDIAMNVKRSFGSLVGIALILVIAVTMVASTSTPASALGGGQVLPAGANAHSYSLVDAAEATAYFNTGPRTPDTLPENFPFQILYISPDTNNTFFVDTGTMLYVPVLYSDNSEPVIGTFPDVTDPAAVSAYYYDPQQLGTEFLRITVDGNITNLGPEYAVGTETPGLPTGGDDYTGVGAFLTPLSKGTHTVTIAGRLTGAFIQMYPDFFPGGVFEFEISYTVVVQ